MAVSVTYSEFFDLPASYKSLKDCKAKCKICHDSYKFTPTSKGNLLKHLKELFSVPSSSAPVEHLFSKAGILLSQRRTRIRSDHLEQLLFFK